MRSLLLLILVQSFPGRIFSQSSFDSIKESDVARIISYLASDSLKGRGNYTPELWQAANFIAKEFEKDSLLYLFNGTYFQPFTTKKVSAAEMEKDSFGRYDATKVITNVVGVLPGRRRKEEYVIFSAHFDHMGTHGSDVDNIYNGANDDASGTTALLTLARYFADKNNNERTLIFCAFAGEELGLWGSKLFAGTINDPSHIVAVINIEMIGKPQSGKNTFFITGQGYSNLKFLMKETSFSHRFKIVNEPDFHKGLFQRSDNYPFALQGIPAHSIMTSDDSDECYHKPCDEVSRIDIPNMTNVIRAIVESTQNLVKGIDRPTRIRPEQLR